MSIFQEMKFVLTTITPIADAQLPMGDAWESVIMG